jgi:hypothetical protein
MGGPRAVLVGNRHRAGFLTVPDLRRIAAVLILNRVTMAVVDARFNGVVPTQHAAKARAGTLEQILQLQAGGIGNNAACAAATVNTALISLPAN